MRVYCLKTLKKLSIYPLGNTPSAPSECPRHQCTPWPTPRWGQPLLRPCCDKQYHNGRWCTGTDRVDDMLVCDMAPNWWHGWSHSGKDLRTRPHLGHECWNGGRTCVPKGTRPHLCHEHTKKALGDVEQWRQGTYLVFLFIEHEGGNCQGITPSNSKGGLPAPEARARTEEGGIRDEIDPSPSRLKSSQDKAGPQTAELTQLPKGVEGRADQEAPLRRKQRVGMTPSHWQD